MLDLYDSTTAPTVSSRFSKNAFSDLSDDLSRIRPGSKKDSRNDQRGSGISEWLEIGMTKSEKEYKKLKGNKLNKHVTYS
jgi:hypothetical protein